MRCSFDDGHLCKVDFPFEMAWFLFVICSCSSEHAQQACSLWLSRMSCHLMWPVNFWSCLVVNGWGGLMQACTRTAVCRCVSALQSHSIPAAYTESFWRQRAYLGCYWHRGRRDDGLGGVKCKTKTSTSRCHLYGFSIMAPLPLE